MNARAETGTSGLDTVKLVVAALLLAAGIWGFYFFGEFSLLLRTVILLIIASGAAALALLTDPGRALWRFALDSRMEVRKVVWPTRQETMQTTLIVIVMVIVLSLVLWMFDSVLMAILRFLTRQGG